MNKLPSGDRSNLNIEEPLRRPRFLPEPGQRVEPPAFNEAPNRRTAQYSYFTGQSLQPEQRLRSLMPPRELAFADSEAVRRREETQ